MNRLKRTGNIPGATGQTPDHETDPATVDATGAGREPGPKRRLDEGTFRAWQGAWPIESHSGKHQARWAGHAGERKTGVCARIGRRGPEKRTHKAQGPRKRAGEARPSTGTKKAVLAWTGNRFSRTAKKNPPPSRKESAG
jgi:hypothetical protein